MSDKTPSIEVRGLTKRFGPLVAVDHLSFSVEPGTITGFLGPNGAGKTTTLRMLLGLVEPSEGTATVAGRRYRDLPDPLRQVGAVLEASSFYPGRTARDHLRIQAMAGRVPSSRVGEVLDLVGLADAAGRRVGQFSLGMRQRLGLATALLTEPAVLILDEPANGLDPEGVHWLRDLLRAVAASGRTVLVSSHLLAEVAQTVDSVVILDHGRLVTHSSLEDLTAGTRPVRVRTPQAEELRSVLVAGDAGVRLLAPDRLEVTNATPEKIGLLAAARQIPIFETTTDAPNLEDVFLRLTSESTEEAFR
ncbi:MAG: ABC transporter ATP-binding protein [Acidimicrobiales bacterium]|nr:ABC transporter ATP-binding protein [Acidimicrobiales bacterium]